MALGRGLGELLNEVEVAYDNNTGDSKLNIYELDVHKIESNPHQPRKIFNEEKLQELSQSLIQHGLLQPIIVTKNKDTFILIAGERRLKASKLAGFDTIQAIVIDIDDSKLRELALIENIQRDDLNILELAYSYVGLINEHKVTHEELAQMVAKSRSAITNTLRLLTLSDYTREMLGSSQITAGHAKVLIGLKEEKQKIIVDSIIEQQLNVRETEQLVRNLKSSKNEQQVVAIKKSNKKINFKPLQNIIHSLDKEKLSITTGKNYLKIKLNSAQDVEKLLEFFVKS